MAPPQKKLPRRQKKGTAQNYLVIDLEVCWLLFYGGDESGNPGGMSVAKVKKSTVIMYITVYLIFTHSTIAKNQVKVDVVKYNTSIIEKTHILAERS